MSVKNIIVFTDGSSTVYKDKKNNNLKYGGIGVYFGKKNKNNISKGMSGEDVTNQRAELKACIMAIQKTIRIMKKTKDLWTLTIYSDSMYSIKCATEWAKKWILYGWKRKSGGKLEEICNLDLIKKLYMLACTYPVIFKHVKAHQKEPAKDDIQKWNLWEGNMMADKLATSAKDKVKNKSI